MFIPQKYEHIVFAFFMALFMSCLMSFFITLVNIGLVQNLFFIWLKAWGTAFIIAFPVVIGVSPLVKKAVKTFIKK